MAEKATTSQTSLQRAASENKRLEESRVVVGPKKVAVVNGGNQKDLVEVRLTRRFQDLVQMHDVGTLLTIPRDKAPKSAKLVEAEAAPVAPPKSAS